MAPEMAITRPNSAAMSTNIIHVWVNRNVIYAWLVAASHEVTAVTSMARNILRYTRFMVLLTVEARAAASG